MNEDDEVVSIAQLFEEELEAVLDMADSLRTVRASAEIKDWFEITAEIVKLEQTAQYLEDRLNDEVPSRWLK